MSDDLGRVIDLTIGGQSVAFCSENSTPLTGGFYIRDNTPFGTSNLPVNPAVNPNLLNDEYYARFDDDDPLDNYEVIEDDEPGSSWYWSTSSDSVNTTIRLETVGGNNVAWISVEENPNPNDDGFYGAIYRDIEFPDYTSHEHELYYLFFEVKTGSGWRTDADEPYAYEDGGEFDLSKFGRHRVSARVEWFAGVGGTFERAPTAPAYDIFYAYETTDAMSGERLTRFCGRTYRPFAPSGEQARTARIALVVEGYMPDDDSTENTVYFDNIAFFKAPETHQVYGALPGTEEKLYKDASLQDSLDLKMTLSIQPIQPNPLNTDSYLLFTGTLINDDDLATDQPARSIDLGFTFPLLDDTSSGSATQQLEWHYDVSHASYVDVEKDVNDEDIGLNRKIYPYAMSSHVDARPEYEMSGIARPISVDRKRSLGLQISSYPISALAIHDPAVANHLRGLSFGDSLDLGTGEQVTPNISHFGYRIDRLTWESTEDYVGRAYIEFSLGLPAENALEGNETKFSFILFRSDDADYEEQSVFREGLQKYQRSFYSEFFTRPTKTRPGEDEWLFGGAAYRADPADPNDGLEDRPNQFGIRYHQKTFAIPEIVEIRTLLSHLEERNVSALAYDHPWTANFYNGLSDSMNTHETLWIDAQAEPTSIAEPQRSIFDVKIDQIFTLPPLDKELFYKEIIRSQYGEVYRFPVAAAMTPVVENVTDPRILAEKDYFRQWYQTYVLDHHLIAGLEFDNSYDDCHLDLNSIRVSSFVGNGGRLTYSFNEFTPAVPQVTTNTWFFPHVRKFLEGVDHNADQMYPDFGDGLDSAGENIEQEIIGVNANENLLGGSKYAIMYADVIGFESSTQLSFNNSYESFNFRRSLARDKPVNRILKTAECAKTAADEIPYGLGSSSLYANEDELFLQILNENTWTSLAYGFMPSIHDLLDECIPDGEEFDDFIDDYARDLFWTDPLNAPDARRGYTNIFQMLHLAGWQPITNIVNIAQHSLGAPGDPQDLVINRFGPYEGIGPPNKPFYITLYNNEVLTQTFTDVAEFGCEECIPIGSLESEQEVELFNICEDNYGSNEAFEGKDKLQLDKNFFSLRDRNFLLEIMNSDKLAINGVGNLVGQQMIEHVASGNPPVNDPEINAEFFSAYGDHYSVVRFAGGPGIPPKLRLGGPRSPGQLQGTGVLMDKGLMVFKIWLQAKGDNSGRSSEDETASGDPFYRTFGGGWSAVDNVYAENGSLDAVSTAVPGACALYRIDTGLNGRHQLRVKYPVYQEATNSARYDVYVMEHLEDSFHTLTLRDLPEPSLSVIVDQARASFVDLDDEGFAAIGYFEVFGLAEYELASVVIQVSANTDETGFAVPGVLIADAVKLEAVE